MTPAGLEPASALVAAAAVGLGVLLLGRRGPSPPEDIKPRQRDDPSVGVRVLLAAVVGGSVPALLGLGTGWVALGLVAGGFLAWRRLGGDEPASVRRAHRRVRRELPHLVELFAAALAAGAPPGAALETACRAMPGPAADALVGTRAGLALGRDPAEVWRDLAEHPSLAGLGRSMRRAVESGAPVVEAARRLADDLRAASRAEAEDAARSVGVRAAVPLGLCLLPSFLLLGIVPMVAGAVGALSW